jgi:CheY-like chemotaxis protein
MQHINKKAKILLIGDDFERVREVVRLLDTSGFEVLFALGGRAGLRAARIERPDAVISELGLFDITGLDVCKELREDSLISDTCFIFLTKSFHNRECIAAALAVGADDCLPDRSSAEHLTGKLEWLIAKKKDESAKNEQYQILRSRQIQIVDIVRKACSPGSAGFGYSPGNAMAADMSVISSLANLLDEQIRAFDELRVPALWTQPDLERDSPVMNTYASIELVM